MRIAHGAPLISASEIGHAGIEKLGLSPQGYHLAVARFEPESHVSVTPPPQNVAGCNTLLAAICEAERVAGLGRTVPALPVRDIAAAVGFYVDRFGFEAVHVDTGFAVLIRDEARIHLWQSADTSWTTRPDFAEHPIRSGAEDFLAGTASCRIETDDVDALYAELREKDVLHGVARAGATHTDFGTYEFATVDLDGNLLEFYRWERPA